MPFCSEGALGPGWVWVKTKNGLTNQEVGPVCRCPSASVTHFADWVYWSVKLSSGTKTEVYQLFQNRSIFSRDKKPKGFDAKRKRKLLLMEMRLLFILLVKYKYLLLQFFYLVPSTCQTLFSVPYVHCYTSSWKLGGHVEKCPLLFLFFQMWNGSSVR